MFSPPEPMRVWARLSIAVRNALAVTITWAHAICGVREDKKASDVRRETF